MQNRNIIEVDGIGFETVVSENIITLPRRDIIQKLRYLLIGTLLPGSFEFPCPFVLVSIGLRITNNTAISRQFSWHSTLCPDVVGVKGALPVGGGWLRPSSPLASDIIKIQPGQTATFFPEAAIFWRWGNQFALSFDIDHSGRLIFEPLEPGFYQVRFVYHNTQEEETVYDETCQGFKLIEDLWVGEVPTPFVKLQLVRV